jgi:hypothetical protein
MRASACSRWGARFCAVYNPPPPPPSSLTHHLVETPLRLPPVGTSFPPFSFVDSCRFRPMALRERRQAGSVRRAREAQRAGGEEGGPWPRQATLVFVPLHHPALLPLPPPPPRTRWLAFLVSALGPSRCSPTRGLPWAALLFQVHPRPAKRDCGCGRSPGPPRAPQAPTPLASTQEPPQPPVSLPD